MLASAGCFFLLWPVTRGHPGTRGFCEFLAMSCPWFGVAATTQAIQDGPGTMELCLCGAAAWAALYALCAYWLLQWVLRSFDRCVGRIPGGWTELR